MKIDEIRSFWATIITSLPFIGLFMAIASIISTFRSAAEKPELRILPQLLKGLIISVGGSILIAFLALAIFMIYEKSRSLRLAPLKEKLIDAFLEGIESSPINPEKKEGS